jgi:probable 2-oxoglutarate dehydrogenase E1 component DHKTD1
MEDYTTDEQKNRSLNSNLFRLVYAYRNYGHLAADLDPLGLEKRNAIPELDPSRYGIPESGVSFDLSGIIHIGKKQDSTIPIDKAPIELILSHLKKVYCGKIAYEFRHIPNILERRWFANMVESFDKRGLTRNEKKYIFQLLTKSEVFDHFMGKRFPQVKRYGLEGAESMMVALDALFKSSSNAGIIENVVCMPHRGRLNLLTDLFQFDTTAMFHKILGNSEFPSEMDASGDVLSHLANSLNVDTGSGRPLHISMLHNPSHLEAVNPVALGKARAKQTWLLDNETEGPNCALGDRVMCIQLHGDAAFSGQGVVMETLGLSNLPHFSSGGSIHVVVNNQIGYTTQAMNSRSSIYASDVAKMINAPIIHVNGDFPEVLITFLF